MTSYVTTAFDLKLALLQYLRFTRQWLCVDEFKGADIIADTGREIIEVEVKTSKSDLIFGERAKNTKHECYKLGISFGGNHPNKFLFCVPEKLVDAALEWGNKLNRAYGVIAFDAERFERGLRNFTRGSTILQLSLYLRIVKSANSLHEDYDDKLRWAIARRMSASVVRLTEQHFRIHKQLSNKNRELREALKRYGSHRSFCAYSINPRNFCDCGLLQALED